MTHEQVLEKLQGIFREQFDDESITVTDKTTADDIEDWDSLAHMELLSAIENEFHVRFSMGEVNSFANVGQMIEAIVNHLS